MTQSTVIWLGTFAHCDTFLAALRQLEEQGFRQVTVFSPIPLHEVEEVLKQGPSPVRYFTLGGGILGALTGFVLTIATSLHYPLITGGKPFVSIPPFLVIAFELAILFGALGTVLGLLLNIRLPRLHPEPGYDSRFSEDRFGLRVRCPVAQSDAVSALLQTCGAEEVHREES
jgi:hypothetical protein